MDNNNINNNNENNENENELMALEVILHAGNAKSLAMTALYESREGNMDLVQEKMNEANEEMLIAHKSQTNMLFAEANGKDIKMNILLSHALDHMAMAMTVCELAEEIIHTRKRLCELQQG